MVITGVFTSEAVQGPSISLDMLPDGNGYDGATNTLTVGSVDSCLATGAPGNDQQHFHTAHLVVRDVEDLVAWQARMNYDGGRMRPHAVNFTPFFDESTGQNVSFVNLPLDSGFHRDLIPAIQIPPPAAEPQTALIGSTYVNEQNAAVSADTPPKQPPDDSWYSAANGGVLAALNLVVAAGQAGQSSLYIDLDDRAPNAPGSTVIVFTGEGTSTIDLSEISLGDGFHGEGVPCVPVAPPTPPGLAPAAGTSSDAAAEIVRWGSLTVLIPEDSGVVAVEDMAQAELKPPHGGQVLLLFKGSSLLAIDADSGRNLQDTVEPKDRPVHDQILSTMVVGGGATRTGSPGRTQPSPLAESTQASRGAGSGRAGAASVGLSPTAPLDLLFE